MPVNKMAILLNLGKEKPGLKEASSQGQPKGDMTGESDSVKDESSVGAMLASAASLGVRSCAMLKSFALDISGSRPEAYRYGQNQPLAQAMRSSVRFTP